MKICIATGTRAEWGLLSPLASQLKGNPGVELQIIATNMHLMDRYGHTVDEIRRAGFCVDAEVPMPDTGDSRADRVRAMAVCIAGFADALERLRPDIIVILGDRYEMLAVASAAAVMCVPIAHIAGGEISEGAIDDSIRHAITKLSSLHFTETEAYRQRVIQMGEQPCRVVNAGALGVWNVLHQKLQPLQQVGERLGMPIGDADTFLITYHPATLDTGRSSDQMRSLVNALECFPTYKKVITYPNNDAGNQPIIDVITDYAAANPSSVRALPSLGLAGYLSVMSVAAAVVGNSSSGIIEAPSMGVPTVDIGIRQKGRIAAQSVIHCAVSTAAIRDALSEALTPEFRVLASKKQNPYYHPDTVGIIASTLLSTDPTSLPRKQFFDLNIPT